MDREDTLNMPLTFPVFYKLVISNNGKSASQEQKINILFKGAKSYTLAAEESISRDVAAKYISGQNAVPQKLIRTITEAEDRSEEEIPKRIKALQLENEDRAVVSVIRFLNDFKDRFDIAEYQEVMELSNDLNKQDEFLAKFFLLILYNSVGEKGPISERNKKIIEERYLSVNQEAINEWRRNVKNKAKVENSEDNHEGLKHNQVRQVANLKDTNEFNKEAKWSNYLHNTDEKYSKVKTVFYPFNPEPLCNFYICNDVLLKGRCSDKNISQKRIEVPNIFELEKLSHFVILTGIGGMGKSLTMVHFLLDTIKSYYNNERKYLPVFIPLFGYDKDKNLYENIYEQIRTLNSAIDTTEFEAKLITGEFIFLFDGLDELEPRLFRLFTKEMEILTDSYPQNIFVITSRPTGDFSPYKRFTVMEIQPSTMAQVNELINRLIRDKSQSDFLKKLFGFALKDEPDNDLPAGVQSILSNPFFLTSFILQSQGRDDTSLSNCEIFYFIRRGFRQLLDDHDKSKLAYRRKFHSAGSIDDYLVVLREFCARTYLDRRTVFDKAKARSYLHAMKTTSKLKGRWNNVDGFLLDACSNVCIMQRDEETYRFTSGILQVYFFIEHFLRQEEEWRNLGRQLHEMSMKESPEPIANNLFNLKEGIRWLGECAPRRYNQYIIQPYFSDHKAKSGGTPVEHEEDQQ